MTVVAEELDAPVDRNREQPAVVRCGADPVLTGNRLHPERQRLLCLVLGDHRDVVGQRAVGKPHHLQPAVGGHPGGIHPVLVGQERLRR